MWRETADLSKLWDFSGTHCLGNPWDARWGGGESAPLVSNLSRESRKTQEGVQMLRTGYHNLFLLGTHAERPEVRFLTPVSLFFPIPSLIGVHKKGSRERGKKGAADQWCPKWEQVQRQGTGRVWSRGVQREKFGRRTYTASFMLCFCAGMKFTCTLFRHWEFWQFPGGVCLLSNTVSKETML